MNRRKFLTWLGLAPVVTKVLAEDISKETPNYVVLPDPVVNHNVESSFSMQQNLGFYNFPEHLPDPCYFDHKKGKCVPVIEEEPEWIEKYGITMQYNSLLDEHIRIRGTDVFINGKKVDKKLYVLKGKIIHFKSKKGCKN